MILTCSNIFASITTNICIGDKVHIHILQERGLGVRLVILTYPVINWRIKFVTIRI